MFKANDDSTATVIMADALTTNGVVHVIGEVLVPPSIGIDAFLETCDGSGSSSHHPHHTFPFWELPS